MFLRALKLLGSNPLIVIPGLVVGGIAALLTLAWSSPPPTDYASVYVAPYMEANDAMLGLILQTCATLLSFAFIAGMAQAAWEHGRATLGDGFRAWRHDFWKLLVAVVLLGIIGLVAAVASSRTYGIPLAIYAFLFVYTFAAVVVDGIPGHRAIVVSARLAFARPLATLLVIVVIAAASLAFWYLAGFIGKTPHVGLALAAVVNQALVAYLTLVIVGEYMELRPTPATNA